MIQEEDWLTLRIFYYDQDKDSILLDCIFPLIEELRLTYGDLFFYLKRHWQYGPHIDLNLSGFPINQKKQVKHFLMRYVSKFLMEHPSNEEIDSKEYLILSKKLGALEYNHGPYTPIYKNNTVMFIDYKRNTALFGDNPLLIGSREVFLNETMPILKEIIRDSKFKEERLIYCMCLMALIADKFKDGIQYGYLSFKSHAEGFLHQVGKRNLDHVVIKEFKDVEARVSGKIESFLAEFLLGKVGIKWWNDSQLKVFREWNDLIVSTMERLSMSEDIRIESSNSFEKIIKDKESLEGFSSFHKHLLTTNKGIELLESKHFNAYRFIINIFYEQLPIVGFNAKDRNMMCFILSNAVEKILECDWKNLMGYKEVK
ncbi:lantibiotic dehydratase C-terminal domain-containing protein [Bacillus cereus]|uniref:lantibiotic dehydratase C-terminal domain-containing protein n=1 Tax=Bacillus cereus TaxID=1396 RepID=UPI000BED7FBF|nr:lantibiotic dehydratase C-terminal domain-containing protein [Bacillus cereus]PEE35456.1 hypothetical protein CON59_15550 [Bacillus cereus]PET49923.1 hypothetical protein CN523_07170 [Bacillus cereus]PEV86982.1 hypothetical protein CN429_03140 [Bacillus cereus]PFA52411.1 hypothetical protein CN389_21855 [Bacillus cereus]PFD73005.1 hypothetical protein CN271_12715 [Bacillus cereus]